MGFRFGLVGWLCVEREGEEGRFGSQCWLHVSVGCLCPSQLVGTRAGVRGEVPKVSQSGRQGRHRRHGKARQGRQGEIGRRGRVR